MSSLLRSATKNQRGSNSSNRTRFNVNANTISIVLILANLLPSIQAAPCQLCNAGPSKVPFPDRRVGPDSQAPANTCGFLELSAPFVESGTDLCMSIRSVQTMCGCNIAPNACSLCPDGSRIKEEFKDIAMPELDLLDYLTGVPNDSPPFTCESFESYWHARTTKDDPVCLGIDREIQSKCGCFSESGGDILEENDELPPNPGNGTETNSTATNDDVINTSTQVFLKKCQVCPLGEAVPFPDKVIKLGTLPVETCSDLEFFANLADADTQECAGIQGMGSFCGCTVPESRNQCPGMCPSGLPPRHPDLRLNWFSSFVNTVPQAYQTVSSTLTCELMDAIAQGGSGYLFGMDESLFCLAVELKSWVCGCDGDWRQVALTWTYRMSGVLSLLVRDV